MPELDAIPPDCLSELVLDEWSAGELSAEQEQRCEAHLAGCAACRARKLALEQANHTFYSEAPSFQALKRKAPAPKAKLANIRWLSAPLLAACAALAFMAVRQPDQPAPDTRSKGAARIGYFVKRGEAVTRGDATTVVHPRDAVRFVYSADRASYLAIFSADASGVGVYFPNGRTAQPISAGQDVALDFSVELDNTLGRERVTALFCPEAFEIEPVQSALSRGSPLPASVASCERAGFELNKQRSP
ncbi:MAG TPA: zf-HC2 domain-containing protein [Polyangiales bacterium]|nr:zf-HC2 domain-containing protein [Polyangiales bacterium]